MKIKTLAIKNIASIAAAEIDFTAAPLKDAPLFLICGETGAGKSTILDAICLALYGTAPRFRRGASARTDESPVPGVRPDDPRQAVRRGAAEAGATLRLAGNDGCEYEASWKVSVKTKGPDAGGFKSCDWTWKDLSPGGLTYVRAGECKAVSLRATGLDFDQFCRTSLLAQGEFTKFLLGSGEDKALILEKLTDTGKYSVLGSRISAEFLKAKRDAASLQTEIEAYAGLAPEERAALEERLAAASPAIAESEKELADLRARSGWLETRAAMRRKRDAARTGLAEACAALKAEAAETQATLDAAETRLADAQKRLDADARFAGAFANADVALACLRDAREARLAQTAAAEAADALLRAGAALEAAAEAARAKAEAARSAAEAKEAAAHAEEAALEAMRPDALQVRKSELESQKSRLEKTAFAMEEADRRRAALDAARKRLATQSEQLAEMKARRPALEAAADAARRAADAAAESRRRQAMLIESGIEKLAAMLHPGEKCPLCGATVEKPQAKECFRELLSKLDGEWRAAEKEAGGKKDALAVADAQARVVAAAIAAGGKEAEEEESRLRIEAARLQAEALSAGAAGAGPGDIAAALSKCNAALESTGLEIESCRKKEKSAKAARAAAREAERAHAAAEMTLMDACRIRDGNLQKAQAESEKAAAAGDRAAKKTAQADAALSLPGWQERWNADPAGFEARFKLRAREFKKAGEDAAALLREKENLADRLAAAADALARAAVVLPGADAIAPRRGIPARGPAETRELAARLEDLESELRVHCSAPPAGLTADDTPESIEARAGAAKARCDALKTQKGAMEQRLADDDARAAKRAALEAALGEAIARRDAWQPLNALFGGEDGKKIRAAIQSYVLKNVLAKANIALKRLAGRYELSCTGMSINVRDSLECGAERPAGTLSGGESFLVSLALALGLSGMGAGGLGADMLFIDEGFGTLGGAHLDCAIEALENLNSICGSRKVGVISHVERLRERIRTHIEVSRDGRNPGTVRIRG